MTLLQKYNHLFNDLTLFGRTIKAIPQNIDALQEYAQRCAKSNIPLVKSNGFKMNRDITLCNNDLNCNNI
ncbi:MAG: hypothetical protein ABIP51_23685 [Bacteroidia bacterium]